MERKKKERKARSGIPPKASDADNLGPAVSDLHLLLPGMIGFLTGAKSYEAVAEITEKCRRFGGDLLLQQSSPEKKSEISSRWLEAEQ